MTDAFAAGVILSRLAPLTAEAKGARQAKDPEHIHRMRVASRRLRAALNLFESAGSAKWRKGVRKLTRALAGARDADVQIEMVQKAIAHAPEVNQRAGLKRLLLRLKQKRKGLQAGVIKALDKFEKSGLADAMAQALAAEADPPAGAQGALPGLLNPDLYTQAHTALAALVQAVLAFDQAVRDPANVDDLHRLRIAFKRLRYSLEIFAPLYNVLHPASTGPAPQPADATSLDPYITIVKTFQQILGDIHDCDVWIAYLPTFLEEERQRTFEYFGHARSLKALEPGLHYLSQERHYHRNIRYDEFRDLWQAHIDGHTWESLESVSAHVPLPAAGQPPPADGQQVIAVVALLGDIHANLPALEAVLTHARARGAQHIWNVGDIVGYGPFPDEVVRRLKQENALSLIGNYDLKVLQVKQKKDKWKKTKRSAKLLAFEWAFDHLSSESRQYLRRLPPEQRLSLHGKRFLLVHGTPESNEEGLTPATPLRRLREIAAAAASDFVISGHSHQPFARQVDGVWFINTGSVGRPDDGDPRAGYALLSLGPDEVDVQHFRVEYDTGRVADAIRDYGLPASFARIFVHGRSLDDLVIED